MLSVYIHPNVDSAIPAEHVWLKHHLNALEQPQCRTANYVLRMRNLSYEQRLKRNEVFSGGHTWHNNNNTDNNNNGILDSARPTSRVTSLTA
ncbi:unnamed protein product, partial [Dicrocoelium dendriticum]